MIETLASEHLERGLETGHYNSRGVTMRNPTEGGEQERQLAKRYEKAAALMDERWHRTAAMLRRLADTYRRQARHEDNEAERMGILDA